MLDPITGLVEQLYSALLLVEIEIKGDVLDYLDAIGPEILWHTIKRVTKFVDPKTSPERNLHT